MGTWEERMAQKAMEKRGAIIDPGPKPSELPPDSPACCFEWRMDGVHGWGIFRTCGGCNHPHHEGEIWIA